MYNFKSNFIYSEEYWLNQNVIQWWTKKKWHALLWVHVCRACWWSVNVEMISFAISSLFPQPVATHIKWKINYKLIWTLVNKCEQKVMWTNFKTLEHFSFISTTFLVQTTHMEYRGIRLVHFWTFLISFCWTFSSVILLFLLKWISYTEWKHFERELTYAKVFHGKVFRI